ncbi:MAG: glycosyltransferase [Bacteroidales bacterium]|nr:glycosyltransferase [Bacteroidales bacterium]
MFTLQNLAWKKSGRPEGTDELYYSAENIEPDHNQIALKEKGSIDFFSYSNIFNWKKWYKYTGLKALSLHIEGKGDIRAVVSADGKEILRGAIDETGLLDLEIPFDYRESLLSVRLESDCGGSFVSGRWQSADRDGERNPVRIALVFCTFNRDDYLFPNLQLLKDHLPENYGVFVVDNGNRIPADSVTSLGTGFRIYHNNNTGGSGGFTRGLVEALRDEEDWTHVHFMDDDVVIEIESLLRTVSFLSLLKEDFKDFFLSGSMLRLDKPWILHENTAMWTGIRIFSHNNDIDLRRRHNVLHNEIEPEGANHYAAWWYCVIPLVEEMRSDLPFPFFIYGDDMEYGLRRAGGIISMNGVCVWHEPFEKKFNAVLKSYFLSRNLMIVNTMRSERFGFSHVWGRTFINFLVQLFVHDYVSAQFVLDSLVDFLKGPEYIMKCDSVAIIGTKNGEVKPLIPADKDAAKGYYPIKLNNKKNKAPYYFVKKRIVAYDYNNAYMELRKRSLIKAVRLTGRFLSLSVRLAFRYGEIRDSYSRIKLDIEYWDTVNIPGEQHA